jgi:hypothetical protein
MSRISVPGRSTDSTPRIVPDMAPPPDINIAIAATTSSDPGGGRDTSPGLREKCGKSVGEVGVVSMPALRRPPGSERPQSARQILSKLESQAAARPNDALE